MEETVAEKPLGAAMTADAWTATPGAATADDATLAVVMVAAAASLRPDNAAIRLFACGEPMPVTTS